MGQICMVYDDKCCARKSVRFTADLLHKHCCVNSRAENLTEPSLYHNLRCTVDEQKPNTISFD